jgi:hypothetical protein
MFTKICTAFAAILFSASVIAQQGVSISSTPILANPAAMLDVTSTSKGILIPRLTTVQRNAIGSVPDGLMVYDSTLKKYMYFNQAEIAWKLLGSDTLQIPFRKTFNINTGGGFGYSPSSALFSLVNNGSNAAGFFRQRQTGNTRGDALYAEYDGNLLTTGYNSAFAAYGMRGRYTVGVSAYSDSTAAISAYNIYRGTAIMAQNSVNGGGGPYAGVASAIFNSNKTLEGYACGIYQDAIQSSPIVFSYNNAAIMGYSEAGAGGKFFGTDTAIHAIGNTYLMGNVRIANGTQGVGKVLRSDGSGNATWTANTSTGVLNIPAAAFHALNGNGISADYSLDANASSPYNDITITNSTTNAALVASIQLPQGASITSMTLYAYDNNSTVGIKADLVVTPVSGTGNLPFLTANTGAAFASPTFYNSFAGSGIPVPIDNSTNSYLLKIYPVDGVGTNTFWGSLLYIKAVVLNYTYSPYN